MKPGTILSMEQALSMTTATLRFVHMGWRVIKLEATPQAPGALPGDPNRYIGEKVAAEDQRSYFIAPNVGKESIALNLKTEEGRAILQRLLVELDVDIFCCNTLPRHYEPLGIDPEALRAVKPDLIWAGISAMGPDYPDQAGYDPTLQAFSGFMDVTGDADGPPMLSGIPLIDLKCSDETFAQIWIALAERLATGSGKTIHVSMLQAAASWLITLLPLIDFDCADWELFRCGNEHRKFVPTNAYPTRDGAVLLAIGTDMMWQRFVAIDAFRAVDTVQRHTNTGRIADRDAIHRDIAAATKALTTDACVAHLRDARIPHAPIHTVRQVIEIAQIAGVLTRTKSPDGKTIRMQPKAVHHDGDPQDFAFPPRYGAQTGEILREAGYAADEIATFTANGVVGGMSET